MQEHLSKAKWKESPIKAKFPKITVGGGTPSPSSRNVDIIKFGRKSVKFHKETFDKLLQAAALAMFDDDADHSHRKSPDKPRLKENKATIHQPSPLVKQKGKALKSSIALSNSLKLHDTDKGGIRIVKFKDQHNGVRDVVHDESENDRTTNLNSEMNDNFNIDNSDSEKFDKFDHVQLKSDYVIPENDRENHNIINSITSNNIFVEARPELAPVQQVKFDLYPIYGSRVEHISKLLPPRPPVHDSKMDIQNFLSHSQHIDTMSSFQLLSPFSQHHNDDNEEEVEEETVVSCASDFFNSSINKHIATNTLSASTHQEYNHDDQFLESVDLKIHNTSVLQQTSMNLQSAGIVSQPPSTYQHAPKTSHQLQQQLPSTSFNQDNESNLADFVNYLDELETEFLSLNENITADGGKQDPNVQMHFFGQSNHTSLQYMNKFSTEMEKYLQMPIELLEELVLNEHDALIREGVL